MTDLRKYVQGQDFFLAGSGVTLSATSIVLTSMLFPDDETEVTTTDIGSLAYAVIEPETSNAENISFTGITQNANGSATLTGVTRGLEFKDPYTANASLRIAHAGGSTLRISNTAPFYSEFANKNNNETIGQVWTFDTAATPLITDQPTSNTMAANKLYVDSVAIAGAPNASEVTKGITLLSVAAAVPATPIAVGDNDTRVPTQGENNALVGNGGTPGSSNTYATQQGFQEGSETYAASAIGTDAYAITTSPNITALTDGMIVRFKADVANTGAATLALGTTAAKAIVIGVSTALSSNAILAGTIAVVVYSLTNDNYQLQTPDANASTAINATIFDAKGDIIAATAADTASRLGVGANDTTLVADSAQATGLKWQAKVISNANVASRDLTAASGSQTIAHSLGVTPKYVRFSGIEPGVTTDGSFGWANGSINESISFLSGAVQDNAGAGCLVFQQAGASQTATAALDATNITLTWTKSGSPSGTAQFLWEAYA